MAINTKTPVTKDVPRAIALADEDKLRGQYDVPHLQAALEGLHQDGMIVLKGVVDPAHCDHLRTAMTAEAQEILHGKERGGIYNQGIKSNILQNPPVTRRDCLYDDVFFNPYVIQIANAYLGARPITNFMTANNALASTTGMRQPVHKDITFEHPTCPFFFIANIVLSDFTIENGGTEFWLGSHAHTTYEDQIPCTEATKVRDQNVGEPSCNVRPELVEERRKTRPPIQATCKKGDIMIRDLRTWHAGMPNNSNADRIMIAVGYQAPWYPNHRQRLYLPQEHIAFFSRHGGQPVELRAEFLAPDQLDGLYKNYNFGFEPEEVSLQRLPTSNMGN